MTRTHHAGTGVGNVVRRGGLAGIGLLLGVILLPATRVWAEEAGPKVRYVNTEVTLMGTASDTLLLRGDFEIVGAPHQWFTVYYQLRLDDQTPLKDAAGKDVVRSWGDLFTPDGEKARWSECRRDIPLKDLAGAANLPKNKRTVLWAVCDIWDKTASKYIGSGWDTRTAVVVTADKDGKITAAEPFNVNPFFARQSGQKNEVKVRQYTLATKHLKPKAGVTAYRWVHSWGGVMRDVLWADGHQADAWGDDRGWFFEAIDAPEKAVELAELAHPGAVIIKTAEQYQAVVDAAKKKGYKPGEFLSPDKPSCYGVTVTEEPGLGYRVKMLLIDCNIPRGFVLVNVAWEELTVARDGRIGTAASGVCIRAPESEQGVPAGWTQPLPTDPAGYNTAVRAALTPAGTEAIPKVFTPTEKTAAVDLDTSVVSNPGMDPASWPDGWKD